MSILKGLIAPFQKVLLSKKLCPACTTPLDKCKRVPLKDGNEMVICHCRRMFIYEKMTDSYRRATLEEADAFAKGK